MNQPIKPPLYLFDLFESRFRNRVPQERSAFSFSFALGNKERPWESKALRGEYFRQFTKENHAGMEKHHEESQKSKNINPGRRNLQERKNSEQ